MRGSIRYEGESVYIEEVGPEHTTVRYELKKVLHSRQTPYQRVEVADSYDYGRMLILDGCVNVCERDEANYHEMIAHVPSLMHPHPASVLVVGGGDGGTVRELLKHDCIRRIDLAEIDAEVIAACKRYFPSLASSFDDPRVHVYNEDGVAFVQRAHPSKYSMIIIDSSDPVGPAEGLFTREFYQFCHRILDDNGIVVAQSESPYVYPGVLKQVYDLFKEIFAEVYPYHISVPTYPSGQIYMMMGMKRAVQTEPFTDSRTQNIFSTYGDRLHYLTHDILKGIFYLSGDVKKILNA